MPPVSAPIPFADIRALFESAPGLFLLVHPVDPAFTIAAASDGFAASIGRPRDELIGRALADAVPALESVRDSLRRVVELHEADAKQIERYRIPRPGGSEMRHWKIASSPALDLNGTLAFIVVAIEDVTVQEATKERLLLLDSVLEGIADPIFVKDRDGRFVMVNSANAALFGAARSALPGRRDDDFLPPAFANPIREVDQRVMASGSPETVEDRMVRDGEQRVFLSTKSPWRDATGEIVGIIGMAQDITERKQAEESVRRAHAEIQQREELFRSLANSIGPLVWIGDGAAEAVWFSNRWYETTLSTPVESLGWGWLNCVHPDHASRVGQRFRECAGKGEPWEDTFPLRSGGESWRWHLSRARPIRNDKGETVRWFGTHIDIDKRKAMEDALERANADLKQFASAATHDIREPLRTITIYTELLQRDVGPQLSPEARRHFDYVIAAANRIERLAAGLLEYSRFSWSENAEGRPVDANAALRTAIEALEIAIRESGARITSESLPRVMAGELALSQVFQNLIANAIKYRMPGEPPQVHVSASLQAEMAEFCVADNGIGIDPGFHELVFDAFRRLHGAGVSGAGIGLATCKRIIERLGGRIWVESEEGAGARFHFTMPLAR